MKTRFFILLTFLSLVLICISCEETIILDMPEVEEKIVVEGYIELGFPPYIILTRSLPYFSTIDPSMISNLIVHGANVSVDDKNQGKSFDLVEIYLKDIKDSMLLDFAKDLFKVPFPDSAIIANLSIYTSIEFIGQTNNEYTLNITVEDHVIQAVTTIPDSVHLDSFWFEPAANEDNDSMLMLWGRFKDPPVERNYYRYFTRRNNEPFYPNRFYSVWDDVIYDGQNVTFTIDRGEDRLGEFDPFTYGLFWKGDTVMVKICTLDKTHYEFWSTFEYDRYTGGPFSSPVLIKSNIVGGLGVWGGYGASYRKIIIPM